MQTGKQASTVRRLPLRNGVKRCGRRHWTGYDYLTALLLFGVGGVRKKQYTHTINRMLLVIVLYNHLLNYTRLSVNPPYSRGSSRRPHLFIYWQPSNARKTSKQNRLEKVRILRSNCLNVQIGGSIIPGAI